MRSYCKYSKAPSYWGLSSYQYYFGIPDFQYIIIYEYTGYTLPPSPILIIKAPVLPTPS